MNVLWYVQYKQIAKCTNGQKTFQNEQFLTEVTGFNKVNSKVCKTIHIHGQAFRLLHATYREKDSTPGTC